MSIVAGLTEEQERTRDWARAFVDAEVRGAEIDGVPVWRHYDETETFPWPVVAKAAEVGLYGLEYYTMTSEDETGLSPALILEEVFRGCAGIGLSIFGSGLALAGIAAAGTGEQLGHWAPRIFGTPDDVRLGAYCVSEPDAGSDVSALRTRATKVDGGWLIDGQKIWITNGGIADVHVVVATVDPSLGHRGQASFIVTRDAEGFAETKKTKKLGIRASHTAELTFTECFVPDDQLLGGSERLDERLARARDPKASTRSGALSTFEATRPIVAMQAVGIARAALEESTTYALQRETFGVPIIRHQAIAFKLADMATEIDAARLLCWRGMQMARANVPMDRAEGSMAKLKAGRVAVWATDEAIQIHGGFGYSREFMVEKLHRDAKIYEIFEGTKEIQQLVIGRALARRAGGTAA